MKNSLSLVELAQKVQDQQSKKKDFIADTSKVIFNAYSASDGDNINIGPASLTTFKYSLQLDGESYLINEHAHRQIAGRLNIPFKYYTKMLENQPDLLANNVNTWFQATADRRMIRTLEGNARAFLSDRYRRLDNHELLENILPTLAEIDQKNGGSGLKVVSSDVTETKMYLKVLFPQIETEVSVGDIVQAGIVISNSEVGAGSVSVEPLIFRLACQNGMISKDYSIRKNHVGRASDNDELFKVLSNETLKQDDKAFWMKIADLVKATADKVVFQTIVNKMKEATLSTEITKPQAAIEELSNLYQINGGEGEGILSHLVKGGDLTRYGLLNAVTRYSQDVDSYDRATDLERIGGDLLNVNARQWELIAN